ncbi:GDP-mannose mannosyl hydrolase [Aliidiomarina minuta]|uniref:GDP-mannose mannosyl hydrolase n=1 Tax=Aliidiomarina minuta TaxID=880057 RepID=A0A432W8B3_9GAMM|nr:GDP-mannose mannosyl hydrolase [Aliidiomarina minuta]RUO26261.1 GDP-mannose mannosyl hydrolase [Aliidiomarina minuta]
MLLPEKAFSEVIDRTPLVSIDLIIMNDNQEFLLGLRKNRPAAGFWFVPGGRVLKNERLEAAFRRLTENELGTQFSLSEARSIGNFEHFYENSVFSESISTHYIVLAYMLRSADLKSLPSEQHEAYRWLRKTDLLASQDVHEYSKAYFRGADFTK